MTLIKCSECGSDISDKANNCPKCGLPISSNKNIRKCSKCGDIISAKDKKCPHCFSVEGEYEKKPNKKKLLVILLIIAGILVTASIAVIILFVINSNSEDDKDKLTSYESLFIDQTINAMKAAETAYVSDSLNGTQKNMYTISELTGDYLNESSYDFDGCIIIEIDDKENINKRIYITDRTYMIINATDNDVFDRSEKILKTYTISGDDGWKSNYGYCNFGNDVNVEEKKEETKIDSKSEKNTKSSTQNKASSNISSKSDSSANNEIKKEENTANNSSTNNSSVSVSKQNALKSAKSYLSISSFSRKGLIKQLEYEKFPTEDAEYAADNCGADWKAQALKSAKSYLSVSSFSYKGLKKQLEYEGFTSSEATYGVDNCGANWNEEAAKSAKSYLSISSFSRGSLITQLEYEGFTHEQAVYGVEQNGL